jgi:hypothetical protein
LGPLRSVEAQKNKSIVRLISNEKKIKTLSFK